MKKKNLDQKQYMNYFWFFLLCFFTLIFCSRKSDLQKGIEAIKKGDYAKAVRTLEKSLEADSMNPDVHYNLSFAYANLDSVRSSFLHYLKLVEMESPLKNDVKLKELLANFLNLDPYPARLIPMKGMNQFKGSLSPQGDIIAVAAAKRDIANIYLVTLKGKIKEKITSRGMNTDPDFSPTGDYIVYVSNIDGDDELYLYELKTKKVKKITDNTAKDFSPSFSPDGKEIVFVSNMDEPYKWEIYKINVSSGRIKRLTRNNYWDGFPKFSSDGKFIVFSSKRDGSEDIYRMKKNGGGEKILYESTGDDSDPTLIDDNLFFKSDQNGNLEIFRYNLKTKKLTRITNNRVPDWNPRIAKDGSKMLVTKKTKKRWRLYLIDFKDGIASELLAERIKAKLKINTTEKK